MFGKLLQSKTLPNLFGKNESDDTKGDETKGDENKGNKDVIIIRNNER